MSAPAADARAGLDRGPRLGVDVGSVRVGLAVSDPDGVIATPVETLARTSSMRRLVREVRERGAAVVYIGLPIHLSGAESASSGAARNYAGALAAAIAPVEVWLVDERMSTVSAQQALHASGRAGRSHRQVIDQAAAVVILQSALEAERMSGSRAGERVDADPSAPGGVAEGDE